jgi:hypothetical protein
MDKSSKILRPTRVRLCAKVLWRVFGVFGVIVDTHDHHINLYYGFFSVALANALSDNELKPKQSTHLLSSWKTIPLTIVCYRHFRYKQVGRPIRDDSGYQSSPLSDFKDGFSPYLQRNLNQNHFHYSSYKELHRLRHSPHRSS